ncbi:ArsR/SmtB family transcription factor [Clostridium frigidicarnis]|uniref:DNA-binding transcriptional regulator, ArsR family n=1 Tax=Clostridium frigidicarnis TaxID=84698 RepID=A0A1I0Y811_9CLOT|nr:metalloregulator ArsR/SmtB family transcription factor [Clostridium frigidicarnis]SFB08620.1 DNA-binding transcriptional regulator, ArsR family [Clostridium frigidicarnis]
MDFTIDIEIQKLDILLDTLYFLANRDQVENTYRDYGLYLNDKGKKFLEDVEKTLDKDILNFFFKEFKEDYCIATSLISTELIYGKDINTALLYIRTVTRDEILDKFIKILLYIKFGDYEVVNEEIKDKEITEEYIIETLKELDIEEKFKWNIFLFIRDMNIHLRKFYDFLMNVHKATEKKTKYFEKEGSKWAISFKNKLEKEELNAILDILTKIDANVDEIEKIYIYPKTILSFDFTYSCNSPKNLYIGIGIDYHKVQNNLLGYNIQWFENVIKVLADKDKLEILNLLIEEELYSLEIAERLSLTPASISYHIKVLALNNVILEEKRDNKTYYSLNKEALGQWVNLFKNQFKI